MIRASTRAAACLVALTLVAAACGSDEAEPEVAGEANAGFETAPAEEQGDEPDLPAAAPEPPEDITGSNIDRLAQLRQEAGGETVETALFAFALQFGDLPGIVDVPDPDGSRPFTATAALEMVEQMWTEFDEPTQEAIRRRVLEWLEPEGVPDDDPDDDTDDDPGDEEASGTQIQLASFSAAGTEQREWELRLESMETAIRDRLGGVDLVWRVELRATSPVGSASTQPDTAVIGASFLELLGVLPPGTDQVCLFVMGRIRMESPIRQEAAAGHEMFHCWSLANAGSVGDHQRTPQWFQEGIASWVGEELAAPVSGTGYLDSMLRLYLRGNAPGIWSLFLSDYDALGFWYYVEDRGVDIWSAIPGLYAAATTGDDAAVLGRVQSILSAEAFFSAAAGPVREPTWGSAWTMSGPGLPGSSREPFRDVAQRGDPSTFNTPPGVQGYGLVDIVPPAPDEWYIFQFRGVGWGRARWSSGEEIVLDGSSVGEAWCIGGDCLCPDGNPPNISFVTVADAQGPVAVALQGGTNVSSDTEITILSSEDVCEPELCPDTADSEFARIEPGPAGPPVVPDTPAAPPPGSPEECDFDACVAGNWVAAQEAEVANYLLALARAAPVTPIFERGSMGAEFLPDGTATFLLDARYGYTTPDGDDVVIDVVSTTDALWSGEDGVLEYTVLQIRQDVSIELGPVGTATGPPVIGGGASDPVGSGSVAYTCDGDNLLIDGGVPFFPLPREWVPA